MTNSKTKRALCLSLLSMLVCVSMLIGTTFAWFTDTASTGVIRIQAGTLDVAIEVYDADEGEWVDAEGKTLDFVKATGAPADEPILWEPGCTYKLPAIRIVNKGNLALKYKMTVNGIVGGDAKLLEVIDFTVKVGNTAPVPLDMLEGILAKAAASDPIVISGHMLETAGNEYQGLTIYGIAITVVATQVSSEYDSFGNQYDADASTGIDQLFPLRSTSLVTRDGSGNATDVTVTAVDPADSSTTILEALIPGDAIDGNASEVAVIVDENAATPNLTAVDTSGKVLKTFDVSVTGLKAGNTAGVKVTIFVGKDRAGLMLYHNQTPMNKKNSAADVMDDGDFFYDADTGYLTFISSTFSPFTIVHRDVTAKAIVNGETTYHGSLADAIQAADDETAVYLLKNVQSGATIPENKNVDINLGGYTVDAPKTAFIVSEGATCSIVNGKILAGQYGIVNRGTITELNVDVQSLMYAIANGLGEWVDTDGDGDTDTRIEYTALLKEISGGNYLAYREPVAYPLAGVFGLYNGTNSVVELISGGTFQGNSAAFRNYNANGILSVTDGRFEHPYVYEGGKIFGDSNTYKALFYNNAPLSVTGGTWFGGKEWSSILAKIPSTHQAVQGEVCTAVSQKKYSSGYLVEDPNGPVFYYYTVQPN